MRHACNLFPEMLLKRLDAIGHLSEDDRRKIADLPVDIRDIGAGVDIVREGESPSTSFVVLDGFVCSYKFTGQGKRQIPMLYLPGDMPDLHSTHLEVMDTNFATVSQATLGFIGHDAINRICAASFSITATFWRMTLIDAAIFREWLTNIGQRSTYKRLAHLISEIFIRLRVVGFCGDMACAWPFTQEELADTLGVSSVHVNRVLQQLRGNGLITLKGGMLKVLDWKRLKSEGDFDPGYLHLNDRSIADGTS